MPVAVECQVKRAAGREARQNRECLARNGGTPGGPQTGHEDVSGPVNGHVRREVVALGHLGHQPPVAAEGVVVGAGIRETDQRDLLRERGGGRRPERHHGPAGSRRYSERLHVHARPLGEVDHHQAGRRAVGVEARVERTRAGEPGNHELQVGEVGGVAVVERPRDQRAAERVTVERSLGRNRLVRRGEHPAGPEVRVEITRRGGDGRGERKKADRNRQRCCDAPPGEHGAILCPPVWPRNTGRP